MPDFRCYMFNLEGEILFGVNITAETLDAALKRVFEPRHTKNQNRPSSRLIYALEIRSGSNRLFPESLDASPKSKQVTRTLAPPTSRHMSLPRVNSLRTSVLSVIA
jgi:hypothetical protein